MIRSDTLFSANHVHTVIGRMHCLVPAMNIYEFSAYVVLIEFYQPRLSVIVEHKNRFDHLCDIIAIIAFLK